MKSSILAVFSVLAMGAFAETGVIGDIVVSPSEKARNVEITYRLTGGEAIVTMEVWTNGVFAGDSAAWSATGDVNALVQPDAEAVRRIVWFPDFDMPGEVLPSVSVKLKTWATNDPPNYMAVRVVPDEAKQTLYYVSEEALPGGIGDRRWRTDYLLMRRIPHSTDFWRMGAPSGEAPGRAANEVPHYVKFSKDYYIGVFQVTQGQFASLFGSNPSPAAQQALPDAELRPVTYVKINGMLRNTPTATKYRWPEDGHSYEGAVFMGKLKTRTGIAFDLPTDAQWEYAARAGEKAAMPNGQPPSDASRTDIAWIPETAGTPDAPCDPAPVGSLQANNWGLYDMLGNVAEWTLDWWSDTSYANPYPNNDYHYSADETGGIVDPVGPASDAEGIQYKVIRGLGVTLTKSLVPTYLRVAYRLEKRTPTSQLDWVGFRVVCPCPAAGSF